MTNENAASAPTGGLAASSTTLRKWRWDKTGQLLSAPVRCKRETWYLVRGMLRNGAPIDRAHVNVHFLRDNIAFEARAVELGAIDDAQRDRCLLGWILAPEHATHLQLQVDAQTQPGVFDRLVLHPVADRDPKCHPYANTPRWSTYKPPFEINRVVLPRALESLAPRLEPLTLDWIDEPAPRLAALAKRARQAACIVDPAWLCAGNLTLGSLEALAAHSWVIVDLPSLARLAVADGTIKTRIVTHNTDHDAMSARVDYADVTTRGFALQDVFPYGVITPSGGFSIRAMVATKSWKRHADAAGFATRLASETPWESKCGDVLSAAIACDRGELLATDLPWLVAGQLGRPVAPRLAAHLLRMHLGLPIDDSLQYWNRWQDGEVVVRDIADLARRYPSVRAVRWKSETGGLSHLGLHIDAPPGPVSRHIVLRTGRIDTLESHNGMPPESMMILMRWLARESAERTEWARGALNRTAVTWQFDTADGLRYAPHFHAAGDFTDHADRRSVNLRCGDAQASARVLRESIEISWQPGVHGDGSLELQARLTSIVRDLLEDRPPS
jgi:hypothetical protein